MKKKAINTVKYSKVYKGLEINISEQFYQAWIFKFSSRTSTQYVSVNYETAFEYYFEAYIDNSV